MDWRARSRRSADLARQLVLRHRTGIAIGASLFVAAAVAFRWVRSAAGFWSIDDAGITHAAAFELVDHHSLAPNVEGTPVEGYSNPLMFIVIAFLRLFGTFDPIATHLHLEMLIFAAMITLVWSMLRAFVGEIAAVTGAVMFAAIELVTPATWVWYGSGLENVWVSAGLVLLLWICARTARGVRLAPAWGNAAFAVAITRPEAPAYVVAYYAALLVLARPPDVPLRLHARTVVRALTVTIALYAAFLIWRRLAYGAWWPNTYYAKLHGERHVADHLRDYVVNGILTYCRAGLFASSVLALLWVPKLQRVATILLVFLVASLALPITAGSDWMGEHRFATPFLAMCHIAYAALFAACVANLAQARVRSWRLPQVLTLVAVLVVAGLLKYDRIAVRDRIELNDVTISRVAYLEGGLRWEQQMRLGVPYPVVQIPDAGGTLLVGAMQILDNGYLTDFQMARIGRRYVPGHRDLRVLNQYQHEERRPDLMSENKQFALDRNYLMTRYLPPGGGVLWPRHDLVEVQALDPGARLLHDDGRLRIYLSAETVPTAAPRGLVRCELIVAWTGGEQRGSDIVRGSIDQGDRDEITLFAYQRVPAGIERFALLLGAPPRAGSFAVSLELVRDGAVTSLGQAFELSVIDDEHALQRAVDEVSTAPTPLQHATRLAWLREQLVPRLGMTEFRRVLEQLARADRDRSAEAGDHIMRLRDNARLANHVRVPNAIRAAETASMRRLFETCSTGAQTRIGCLGRTVDRLRRLGYLGTLARVPDIEKELEDAQERLNELPDPEHYRALVGLTLAFPGDVSLQWRLLKLRRRLAALDTLPAL